ncbi:MAG: hypothetical protein J4A00_08900 [Gammaproteobacteria bacterium]|nr:hypothetical protein [Gammaproteobacteria bacterium]
MNPTPLPQAFEYLRPFDEWALASVQERMHKRIDSDFDDLKRFYDTFLPNFKDAVSHLNNFSLEEMPDAEKNLFRIAASFIEAAVAVELLGVPDEPSAYPIDKIDVERASIR